MIIRKAQPDDCEALLAMAADLAISFVVDPAIFRDSFAACLSDDSLLVLLAEVDSEPVGYLLGFDHITFFANGPVAQVEELYVAPNHRCEGVGVSLMRGFEKWAGSRGSIQAVVCTHRSPGFYSAIGYEETAIRFRKRLKPQTEQAPAGDA